MTRIQAAPFVLVPLLALAPATPAFARHGAHHPPSPPPACTPEHAAMGHCTPTPTRQAHGCTPEHAAMGHCKLEPEPDAASHGAHPHGAVPPVTDADRAAAFPPLSRHMEHAQDVHWRVLFDRLEARHGHDGTGQAWEGNAWIGGDLHRLWLRGEGEREGGRTRAADLEALYGRSVSPWWDLVAGVRHEFLPGDGRTWLAIGVQGIAPYWFEVAATFYLGESGRTAAALETSYDLLLTNRLVLQPKLEARAYGRADPEHGTGSGLATVEAGLRLRYEVTRRFAPYAGYAWSRAFGGTADLRRDAGQPADDHGWVAGVRVWF